MKYNPAGNNLLDPENGTVLIQFQEGDEIPIEYREQRAEYLSKSYSTQLSQPSLSTYSITPSSALNSSFPLRGNNNTTVNNVNNDHALARYEIFLNP